MKKQLVILTILIIPLFSLGQLTVSIDSTCQYWNYYQLINKAEKLGISHQYEQADSIYQNAFSTVERPFIQDYFMAFKNGMKLNPEHSYSFLSEAINAGANTKQLKSIEEFKSLEPKLKRKFYRQVKNTSVAYNDSLKKEIFEMVQQDQRARGIWTNWLPWKMQVNIMQKVDTLNQQKLIEICKKHGWPGFSALGENTYTKYRVEDVSLLILHFDTATIYQLLPYMKAAVENGEMYPYHLARCIDYKFMGSIVNEGQTKVTLMKQIYGTLASSNEIIPFGHPNEVNRNRHRMGLEPIKEYALKRKFALPDQLEIRITR